jgi:hypothetical protein
MLYVCEVLSKLFWENGEFHLAEEYLCYSLSVGDPLTAYAMLSGRSLSLQLLPTPGPTEKMDSRVFNLRLLLANVQADSLCFEVRVSPVLYCYVCSFQLADQN